MASASFLKVRMKEDSPRLCRGDVLARFLRKEEGR
jgi:hypothetical protein